MKDPYVRKCRLLRVVDGDTAHMEIDLGYRNFAQHSIRFLGIDCHEIYRGTEEEKKKGQKAKAYVEKWFQHHMIANPGEGIIGSYMFLIRSEKADSFGRYLGEIWNWDGKFCLNEELLRNGLAKPWGK